MGRLFKRLVAGTDFDGLGFRCLRHSFINLVLSKEIPAERLATWTGQLDTKLTTPTVLQADVERGKQAESRGGCR